jgi:hypothetical protein
MASIESLSSILNLVRASATTEYQSRVPQAVQDNISAVGNPILERQEFMNEFIHNLVCRIGLTVVRERILTNPLSVLKKGGIPLGADVQEIIANIANDQGFDGKGDKLLTKTAPDIKVIYHRRNRQSQYPATISRQQLTTAFTSYNAFNSLITGIINGMYSADNVDEFMLTKATFASAITDNNIIKSAVPHIEKTGSPKKLAKAIINAAKFFQFPSTAWNAYNLNRPASDMGKDLVTMCPLENQIHIIRADVMTEIDVEELASAYNMDKVTFKTRVLEVDNFGGASNCYAILCDESYVQVMDNLFEAGEFYNVQGLYWNYWLNHWQTYSLSTFGNAVAFICDEEAISTDKVTLNFIANTTQTVVATTVPTESVAEWSTSDASIATVVDGVVTPHANGTCFIFAINGDSIATVKVTVNIA